MEIKLEDLIPQTGIFSLKLLPEHEVRLRPINLQDEIWMKQKYGDDIGNVFKEVRMREICEITFHQIEDKTPFIKRQITVVNDQGDKAEHTLGGVDLLMSLVSGAQEKQSMMMALIATIGVSRPLIEKLDAEEKKNQAIGAQSLMSSQTNTGGPQKKSSSSRSKR